jgi:hypothetical protein
MSTDNKSRRRVTLLAGVLVILILLILLFLFRARVPFVRDLFEASPESAEASPDVDPPLPPSDIQAEHIAIFDILVTWQDNSENERGFYIYRRLLEDGEEDLRVGSVGENVEAFTDLDTLCGETYHYTVAAYNDVGESPATVCWTITMPPCPGSADILLPMGEDYATDAAYLDESGDEQMVFMADLPGQHGLFDLGDPGILPLHLTHMPADPVYVQDGVPAIVGHRYIAQASGDAGLIIFDLRELGSPAEIAYILWSPGEVIDLIPCVGQEVASVGDYTPGEDPCVSGDGICHPQPGVLDGDCIRMRRAASGGCECGDGVCDPACEACDWCVMDCGLCQEPGCPEDSCGNGTCEIECGEDGCNCPSDCAAGSGYTGACGDGYCLCDETCETCPDDCGACECDPYCGDGICDARCEDFCTCPGDCGDYTAGIASGFTGECGDGVCICGEHYGTCPEDCPPDAACACGDGVCDPTCLEDCRSCPEDCPCTGTCACGDGVCDLACEDVCRCPEDCMDHAATIMPGFTGECGDGWCLCTETPDSCFDDCVGRLYEMGVMLTGGMGGCSCGDGWCIVYCEDECTCPMDCRDSERINMPGFTGACGDGWCTCNEPFTGCEEDCGDLRCECGDGYCNPICREECDVCPADCGPCTDPDYDPALCGDEQCNLPYENVCNCARDCITFGDNAYTGECGDGFCMCAEDATTCPLDCFASYPCECGDGVCDTIICGEYSGNCEVDCSVSPGACLDDHCGDGTCNCEETVEDCPEDCSGGDDG